MEVLPGPLASSSSTVATTIASCAAPTSRSVMIEAVAIGRFRRALFLVMAVAIATRAVGQVSAPTAWQCVDDGDPSVAPDILYFETLSQELSLIEDLGSGEVNPAFSRQPLHWVLDGDNWRRRFVDEPTPKKAHGCEAYDTNRHIVVAFGGSTTNETWEYDGAAWRQRNPAVSPSARARCAMAYDPVRGRVVMFGGDDSSGIPKLDTWEYDGVNWQQRTPSNSPNARGEHAMVYDTAHSVILLMGGRQGSLGAVFFNDLWEYDGTTWRQKNPSTKPEVRARAAFAFDPVRQRAVLFGGYNPLHDLGDTWEWNGSKWAAIITVQSPTPRSEMVMTYDPLRDAVIGFGGHPGQALVNDTWSYDGTNWTRIALSTAPKQRSGHGLVFRPDSGSVVLHGGYNDDDRPPSYLNDTWQHDGTQWVEQTGAGSTTAQTGITLTYDVLNARVVGYSGSNVQGAFPSDLHVYSGAPGTWTSSPSCCPSPDGRAYVGFNDAPGLGGSVLFGGRACCIAGSIYLANDTWVLAASTWTRLDPLHAPPPREASGMAYDSLRQRIVLYGGWPSLGGGTGFGDTWTFDGSDWVKIAEPSSPGGRGALSLAYDTARDRVVLFGNGPFAEVVTWEFDGSSWLARSTPRHPDTERCEFELAYDPSRQITWLFGGFACGTGLYFNDTWAYGPDPDGDGIVGGLDNCPNAANVNQANDDADVAGNVCDCAPSDPGAWSAPQPVSGLLVSGTGTTTLTWADQSAVVGPGVRYDVATGDLIALQSSASYGGATCLVNQTAVPSANDARSPSPGSGYWYLVRACNVCGLGTYGAPALDGASPCP